MYRHILVPVDLTAKNARALETALDLAVRDGAGVTLLHVVEVVPHIPFKELAEFYAGLERSAREAMKGMEGPFVRKNLRVTRKILYGNRAVEIVKYAMKARVDLIVLSSQKVRPGMAGEGWGTISQKVALLSPTHVLLVK